MNYYSGPLNNFLVEDPGLYWTTPPQELTDRMISDNPEEGVYMKEFSRSLRISGAKQEFCGILALLISDLRGLILFYNLDT